VTVFTTDERVYNVVLDGAIRRRALIIARVVDAVVTSAGAPVPPRNPLSAHVDRRGATVRIGSGGTLAVSGRTEQLLPDPSSTTPITFTISIRAHGYRTHVEAVIIAPTATLPIDLGTIALQPLPVRLEGRVTHERDRTAIAGASIVARKSDKIVLLRTPLQRDYLRGTTVTPRTLTPSGTPTTLAAPAARGSGMVTLDDASSFAPGNVVRFAAREYGVIATIAVNDVTLIDPLQHSHAAGTSVSHITASAGTAMTTRRDVIAGDALLPVDTATDATAIEIGGEYHDTGLLSDSDGYFAVDGIGGERAITLITIASDPALSDVETTVIVDYSKPENSVSMRVKKIPPPPLQSM
jgi:hypothetical protein